MIRSAEISRQTNETDIRLQLTLDGRERFIIVSRPIESSRVGIIGPPVSRIQVTGLAVQA